MRSLRFLAAAAAVATLAGCADGEGFGPISRAWNLQGTPTLFVLDHKGVIRYRWLGSPGENAIDEALNKLIKEAEGNDKKEK